jgi:hypothetical protein
MARTMDKEYYKTESKTMPVRWCSPEAIEKESSLSIQVCRKESKIKVTNFL